VENAGNLTQEYYQTHYGSSVAFAETLLENSPLNRPLKQAAPGNAWALGSGHEIKYDYDTNVNGEVRMFGVSTTYDVSTDLYTTALIDEGFMNPAPYINRSPPMKITTWAVRAIPLNTKTRRPGYSQTPKFTGKAMWTPIMCMTIWQFDLYHTALAARKAVIDHPYWTICATNIGMTGATGSGQNCRGTMGHISAYDR